MRRSITPKRARQPSDASVDPTDARSDAGFGPDNCNIRRRGNRARRSREARPLSGRMKGVTGTWLFTRPPVREMFALKPV
jgi:hypothetical protein